MSFPLSSLLHLRSASRTRKPSNHWTTSRCWGFWELGDLSLLWPSYPNFQVTHGAPWDRFLFGLALCQDHKFLWLAWGIWPLGHRWILQAACWSLQTFWRLRWACCLFLFISFFDHQQAPSHLFGSLPASNPGADGFIYSLEKDDIGHIVQVILVSILGGPLHLWLWNMSLSTILPCSQIDFHDDDWTF